MLNRCIAQAEAIQPPTGCAVVRGDNPSNDCADAPSAAGEGEQRWMRF